MTAGRIAQRFVAVPALLLLAGCAGGGTQATPSVPPSAEPVKVPDDVERVLHLDSEGRTATVGTVVPSVRNAVGQDMSIAIATANDGRIELAPGVGDEGRALRFPAFTESGPVGAAVVVARSEGESDTLNPRRRDFAFGARFWLDAQSDGSDEDDGDNLVQRGLFGDDVQYKLQIDGGKPSCLVRGDDGEVMAEASEPVERETWYDVTCERTGGGVAMRLERSDGAGEPVQVQTKGRTGSIDFDRSVPLSIGGKVSDGGEVTVSSVDQFNGFVDDVYVEYER